MIRRIFASCALLLATLAGPAAGGQISNVGGVVLALHRCWTPPREDIRPGMEIVVRLSFNRDGRILGKPRIVYETPGASEGQRIAYRVAVTRALLACTPLPVNAALGSAIAGRLFNIRFVDTRKRKQPEMTHGA